MVQYPPPASLLAIDQTSFYPLTSSSQRVITSFVQMWREGLRGGWGRASWEGSEPAREEWRQYQGLCSRRVFS